MKVFITGATGFIGTHLVRRLVDEGHQVTCLVRERSRAQTLVDMGARLVCGTVNDQNALREGMAGCDWLFHLANLYSMWEPDGSRFEKVNIDGTRAVFSCALEAGIGRVVYVSTVAIFGKPEKTPFDETCSPGLRLFSKYARTKAVAEQIAWEFYRQGLPLVVLYPGIVLGSGDDKASGHYIQDILRRHVPSTIFHHSCSTYVYVGDVVEAMLRAAQYPAAVGQKYLIGKGCMTGRAFADLVSSVSGVPLPLFRLPDWMVLAAAYLLTGAACLIRRPPLWGLSVDAAWTLKHGFQCDGSKAERELGIQYTPIRKAMEEAVESYMRRWNIPRRAAALPAARLSERS